MKIDDRLPVYAIGVTARLLKCCPATLRLWEEKKLIKPTRIGKDRFYSKCDIIRLEKIKSLIRKKGLNIVGVRSLLDRQSCWEIKNCPDRQKTPCPVYKTYMRQDNYKYILKK